MERIRLPLVLVSASLLLGGCGKKDASTHDGPPPLAVVGGQPITQADLIAEISWRQAHNHFVPAPDVLLDDMIQRLATVQRAKKQGLENDPETRRRLESHLITRLRELEIDSKLKDLSITDAELEAAYQARLPQYTRKAQSRYSILFQEARPKSSDAKIAEVKAKLDEALKRAQADPAPGGRGPTANGFGILAVDFSEDQASRHRGGDIGWIDAGAADTRWPRELLEVGEKLENGAISPVIQAGDGFYLIRKTDSRPGGTRPLADVSDELRQMLLREKRQAIEKGFVDDVLKAASPKKDSAALAAMKLPAPSPVTSLSEEQPPALPGAAPSGN